MKPQPHRPILIALILLAVLVPALLFAGGSATWFLYQRRQAQVRAAEMEHTIQVEMGRLARLRADRERQLLDDDLARHK
jgi:hypothetical protein